jgi:tetratricopeptide (TPR) repeat protein
MKNLTAFALILMSFSMLCGQQNKMDSLENLLKTDKEDTNKVNHLNTLAFDNGIRGNANNDSAYSRKAMKLAQAIKYTKGIADAYGNMALYYSDKSDLNRALSYYDMSLKIYHETGNKNEGPILCYMAGIYEQSGNHSKSLEYNERALECARKIKNKQLEGSIYTNIANVYSDESNFPMSLEFNFKAVRIYDSIGDETGLATGMGNIGNTYQDMGERDSALKYELTALKKDEALGNKIFQASTLLNIGGIYYNQKKHSEAIDYELKGLQLFKETGNKDGMALCMGNLGADYRDLGELSKAFTYDTIALRMSEEAGDIQSSCFNSNSIGSIYLEKRDYSRAEKYLLRADTLAEKIKAFNFLKDIDKNLATLYSQTGKWQKSNLYLLKYGAIKDTLFNQDKSKQVGRLEAKYNYDKQLTLQEADAEKTKALAKEENKRQKVIILLIASIALSVLLIAVLIYRSLKSARKEKILIERQKSVMELKALRAQMNPHFIFNVINSIQHFILQHDSEAAEEHLSEFSKLIRNVLENSRHETIPLSEEIKMLESYLKLEAMRFSSKFRYHIYIENDIDTENVFIPPLIVQPYDLMLKMQYGTD